MNINSRVLDVRHSGTSRARPRLAALSLALLLGLAGAVSGCGDDDGGDDKPTTLHADLQAILDDVVAKGVTPGVAVAVASNKGPTWLGAAGVGDVEQKLPMSAQHRFRAGSILKSLVATAVLQAVEQRTLALDDTLAERLPASVTARIANAGARSSASGSSSEPGSPTRGCPSRETWVARHPAHAGTSPSRRSWRTSPSSTLRWPGLLAVMPS